ncbi:hypothetical protein SOASR014_16620 [Pectobacterium carotovorum subsp. carotovorum]|nr:hypothetical protein SOASR014_16620 [Pectobacterium carotovorum subsp. carotovorum]GLX43497.1 hypothetical protein Pcaca01_11650 [Pectobacterium carotovorum subsp. carotovorum]
MVQTTLKVLSVNNAIDNYFHLVIGNEESYKITTELLWLKYHLNMRCIANVILNNLKVNLPH